MNAVAAMNPPSKELTIKSSLDQIVLVEDFVEQLREEQQFKEDVYGNILISVTEAVNNGIMHGNKNDERKKVVVRSEMKTPYLIEITVTDEGEGFDFKNRRDPTAPENLLNEHGRGVFVMEHLADKIEYEGRGNVVRLYFHI